VRKKGTAGDDGAVTAKQVNCEALWSRHFGRHGTRSKQRVWSWGHWEPSAAFVSACPLYPQKRTFVGM